MPRATVAHVVRGNAVTEYWLNEEQGLLVATLSDADRTAARFMQVANRYGDKLSTIENISPTALYGLAAPLTPEPVRQIVEQKSEAGQSVANVASVASPDPDFSDCKES
jgi:hypothetical protein